MRVYINSTEDANVAVEQIVALVHSGDVEPLIGLDIETSPLRSLVGYPNTLLGNDGEPVKANKRLYLEYAQRVWRNNYNPYKLAQLGIYVPTRLTNGNESKNVPARKAWEQFLAVVERTSQLEQARWTEDELALQRAVLHAKVEQLISEITAISAELEQHPKGRVNTLKAKLKRLNIELSAATIELERLMQVDLSALMDSRLLLHVVRVGVQNRIKVDPVQPGRDPHTSEIFLVQFTLRRKEQGELLSWIFNARKVDLRVLLPALRLGRQAKYIGANIKFDLAHLMLALGEAPQNVWCVRVASRMLYLGLKMSHSLAACAKRYAGIELSKEVRNLFIGRWLEEPTEEMLVYAFTDTEVLFPIYDKQMQLAEERGQVELIDVFSRLSYPTAVWELCGVQIDEKRWMEIADRVVDARDEVARQLEQLLLPAGYTDLFKTHQPVVGEEDEEELARDDEEDSVQDTRPDAIIRISQRALVIERLWEILGERFLKTIFPDGKVSLSKDTRELMETEWLRQHGEPHPFFGLYKKWAKLAKQASTYGRMFLWNVHPLTGRIHSTFNIAGTDTGRYSSNSPNLLNIPTPKGDDDVDFRAAFVAPVGYVFGNADYAAMEQRIAADLTGDPVLIALFEADGDGHSVTASMMYHVRQGPVNEPQVYTEEWCEGAVKDTITKVILPASWEPLRVVEFIVKDKRFMLTGENGEAVACSLMELVEAKHKKTTRQSAKTVNLGKQFGMTKYGIARKKNIPLEQAEEIENLYDGVYAVMKEGQDKAARLPFENCITTDDGELLGYGLAYNGLRRWFRLPHNPSRWEYPSGWVGDVQFKEAQHRYRKECLAIEREAKNVGTQGGNAVVTAEAVLLLVELGKAYRPDEPDNSTLEGRLRLGIFPWLAIYDEILALVPKSVDEREANKVIEQAMLEPSKKYIKRVPSKVEANPLSHYWKKF